MSIPISLPVDNIRQALSSIAPLASWKTLALLLALINLKNLPLVWHVSILLTQPIGHQLTLIDSSPPCIPKEYPVETRRSILSQWQIHHHQWQADTSRFRVVRAEHPYASPGIRLQPPQIQQHLLLRPGHRADSARHAHLVPRCRNPQQRTRSRDH